MSEWLEENAMPHRVPVEELHCTLIESLTRPVDYQPDLESIIIPPRCIRLDLLHNAFVLAFHSQQLEMQFHRVIAHGATSRYPSFVPHVTVSYSIPCGYEMSEVKPPTFPLELAPEKTVQEHLDRKQVASIPQSLLGHFLSWLAENAVGVREQCRPIATLISAGMEEDACPRIPQRVLTLPFFLSKDGLLLPTDVLRGVTLLHRYPNYKARAFLVDLSSEELSSTMAEFLEAVNGKNVTRS